MSYPSDSVEQCLEKVPAHESNASGETAMGCMHSGVPEVVLWQAESVAGRSVTSGLKVLRPDLKNCCPQPALEDAAWSSHDELIFEGALVTQRQLSYCQQQDQ